METKFENNNFHTTERVYSVELSALRKDAERYRWLRAGRVLRQGHPTTLIEREVMTIDRLQARLAFRAWCSENELDASIDAAMPANTVFGAA